MNFNDHVSGVSNLSVKVSKFDVMRPYSFHKVLKTPVANLAALMSTIADRLFSTEDGKRPSAIRSRGKLDRLKKAEVDNFKSRAENFEEQSRKIS